MTPIPPGPITVTHEWATDGDNGWWPADSEEHARARLVTGRHPQQTVHRRTRWVSVGDWEEAPRGATER